MKSSKPLSIRKNSSIREMTKTQASKIIQTFHLHSFYNFISAVWNRIFIYWKGSQNPTRNSYQQRPSTQQKTSTTRSWGLDSKWIKLQWYHKNQLCSWLVILQMWPGYLSMMGVSIKEELQCFLKKIIRSHKIYFKKYKILHSWSSVRISFLWYPRAK